MVIEGSQRKITVVDVTIPFEGGADCLQEARQAKEAKYSFLKTFLEGKYEEVSLDAFIIGALGSWDPANEEVLKKLGIGRNAKRISDTSEARPKA